MPLGNSKIRAPLLLTWLQNAAQIKFSFSSEGTSL